MIVDSYFEFKMLKHQDILEAIRNNKTLPLKHVTVFITNVCNQNCYYCYFGRGNDGINTIKESMFLNGDFLSGLVRSFVSLGVEAVTISGGEPTLSIYLKPFIEDLINNDIHVGLITNGTNIQILGDDIHDITWLRFSINGADAEAYSKAHGVSEKVYDEVLFNLGNAIGSKLSSNIGVNFLFLPDNYSNLDSFISNIRDIGVCNIRFTIPAFLLKESTNICIYDLISRVDDLRAKYENETFKIYDNLYSKYRSLSHNSQDFDICYAMKISTVISYNKKVYTCCRTTGLDSGLIGDISNQFFDSFWLSDEVQEFISEFSPRKHCNHKCMLYEQNKTYNYIFSELFSDDYFV